MNRQEYTQTVLSCLRRVTYEEERAIRAELDGHMEDHICALLELGYDEALAEERTMACMGDPLKVGRELNKQYPLGWLVLGRAAKLLAILLIMPILVSFLFSESALFSCIKARINPWEYGFSQELQAQTSERLDLRKVVGDDILRIYLVTEETIEGQQVAVVRGVAYDRIPFGLPASWILCEMTIEDQRGEEVSGFGGYSRDDRARYLSGYIPIEPGDTHVVLRGDRYGQRFSLEVPLPKEGSR